MRVFPALIHLSLSWSSMKTEIKACMMPMVVVKDSESVSARLLKVRKTSIEER